MQLSLPFWAGGPELLLHSPHQFSIAATKILFVRIVTRNLHTFVYLNLLFYSVVLLFYLFVELWLGGDDIVSLSPLNCPWAFTRILSRRNVSVFVEDEFLIEISRGGPESRPKRKHIFLR